MQIPFPRAFVWASALTGVFVLAWDLGTLDGRGEIPVRLHGVLLLAIIISAMLGIIGIAIRPAAELERALTAASKVLRDTASLRDEVWELNRRLRGGPNLAPAFDVASVADPRFDALRDRLARRDEDV